MAYLSTYRAFPYCIIERTSQAIGSGTLYPVGFTWDELIQLFYRIGELKFTASAVFSRIDYGTLEIDGEVLFQHYLHSARFGSGAEQFEVTPKVDEHREAALSCESDFTVSSTPHTSLDFVNFDAATERTEEIDSSSIFDPLKSLGYLHAKITPGPNGSGTLGAYILAQIDFGQKGTSRRMLEEGGLYYPNIQITLRAASASQGEISTFKGPNPSNPLLNKVGTISFLGKALDIWSGRATDAWPTLSSFSFALGANYHWPYDPGDTDPYPGKDGSGPVYNSATGAQLRNPFNIVKRGDGTFYNPNYVAP